MVRLLILLIVPPVGTYLAKAVLLCNFKHRFVWQAAAPASSDVNAPLVFSCRSCRNILGDSWSFVWSNEEMNCVVLDGALLIHKAPLLRTT